MLETFKKKFAQGIISATRVAVTLGLKQRQTRINTLIELQWFIEQRAKFIAQTTLYGYLKTRAGTRYTSLFDDEVFVESINIAKWEIYLTCLSDLTVYATARVGREASAASAELTGLATRLVTTVLKEEDIPAERPKGFGNASQTFAMRANSTDWKSIDDREQAFALSPVALIEWAPIAPQLKEFDTDIVVNSMRFKWKHVRDELRRNMRSEHVLEDWRGQNLNAED